MIFNPYQPSVLSKAAARQLTILTSYSLQVSFLPMAQGHEVIEYNNTTTDTQPEQLLLNIARSHHYRPLYSQAFTSDFVSRTIPLLVKDTGRYF
ncbi:MAG: hypothetical protein ACXV8P_02355 [Methylobacter sp.]